MISSIRKHFPIFNNQETLTRKPFVFLDSAATSQKPQSVIDSICNFYERYNTNVKRGLYPIGEEATHHYEKARSKVATFINAALPQEIIFTKNTTESINLIAQAWALENLTVGDEILITQAEHHANLLPWQYVAHKTGAAITYIPINKVTHLAEYDKKLITNKTKLVALAQSSNVLGAIWQEGMLKEIITQAHTVGAKVMLDGAQAVIHEKVDVQMLDIDFFVFSGHKMFAPSGVGVLYLNQRVWNEMAPYQRGGSMVYSVAFDTASWAENPHKFEAGTPPISSALGLGAAIDFIQTNISFEQLRIHETSLYKRMGTILDTIEGLTRVGNPTLNNKYGHLISFTIQGIHPHDLATYLGREGICVRAGHHCAQPLITSLGYDTLVRASISAYNTLEDIELFGTALHEAVTFFRTL